MYRKNIPKSYWAKVVNIACYLLNRSSTKAIEWLTLEEAWSRRKPDISHLKIFRSQAFVHIPDKKRTNLDLESLECIIVGYNESLKTYKCIYPKTNKVYVSQDVVFNEEDKEENTSKIQEIERIPQAAPPGNSTEEESYITL